MSRGAGRPLKELPSGPGTALAQFLVEHLPTVGLTNEEIANGLGYARPNIVSMWKTRKTKVPLDVVFSLAELMGVDPGYVLALHIDQYVSEHDGIDRFPEIVSLFNRLCTPEEFELVEVAREARRGRSVSLTESQRRVLRSFLELDEVGEPGPYRVLDSADHVSSEGDRRKFALRGRPRGTRVEDLAGSRSDYAAALEVEEAAPDPSTSQLNVRLDASLHTAAKLAALQRRTSLTDLVTELLRQHLTVATEDRPARSA